MELEASIITILPDYEIRRWANGGGLSPFFDAHINPASVDLTLSSQWRDFHDPNKIIHDTNVTIYAKSAFTDIWNLFFPWHRLPTMLVASTLEVVSLPMDMAAEVKMKTTPTREGLGQIIADWVDPGFRGQLTLMLYANKTVTLHTADRICQLVLYKMARPERSYAEFGHYMNQSGPTLSWRKKYE